MGLILLGVLGTIASVGVSEKALANWMTPSGLRPRAHHWFWVSPDETQVAACVSKRGEATIRRVLDLRTGNRVDLDLTDSDAWYYPKPNNWWKWREQSQVAAGATAVTISWPGHPVERTFRVDRNHTIWPVSAEGIVFEHVRDTESYSLLRHDLASGQSRTVVRSNPRAHATISPDGERLLLNEDGLVARKHLPEHRGVKILDGRDGAELGWIEAPWAVVWIGAGHRYVQTELDERLTVFDLERGTKVALDVYCNPMSAVHVLPDRNVLLQNREELTLHDGTTGELVRRF